MRTLSVIARYLAGVIFLVMGLNGFLNFIPLPPPGGIAGQFMGALYVSHYLWVIFAFQVIAGVLLLVNRYIPLAVAVLAPVIVNILVFHASMAPSGLPMALFVAALWGRNLHRRATGVFRVVPVALAAADLTAGERNQNMTQKLTVVVTGSTGKQGGAVTRGLLERGHKVRAVTRDPNSSHAKSLAHAGATLVAASLDDSAAIKKALEGATSLFAMTMPSGGTDAETRQGVAAADAAKAVGVHLVFTSVGSANRQTGVPHFDSKYEVEKHIAKIGVRATILAPASFMENLYFIKEQLAKGIYAAALPPTRELAQVAVTDIGAVAVRVLEDAGRFTGKRFDLAGDELNGNDAMAILSRVTGRPVSYYQVPFNVIRQRMGEDAVKMYEWFDRVGFTVDRAALRREFPDVAFRDFESWAKTQDWSALHA
jgi:uncharacterized protein YbjT (DUF2867 family)